MKYKIGDLVRITDSYDGNSISVGHVGKIVYISDEGKEWAEYDIEFDFDSYMFHNGNGRVGTPKRIWCYEEGYFELESSFNEFSVELI